MIPTAVRLAAASSKSASQKASLSRAVINVASVGAIATLVIGWPIFISRLETKNHGAGTVPLTEKKVY